MTWFGDPLESSFDTGLGTSLWLWKTYFSNLKKSIHFLYFRPWWRHWSVSPSSGSALFLTPEAGRWEGWAGQVNRSMKCFHALATDWGQHRLFLVHSWCRCVGWLIQWTQRKGEVSVPLPIFWSGLLHGVFSYWVVQEGDQNAASAAGKRATSNNLREASGS